ncbi:phosphatase PAP2 family protein [Rhodococcus sp. X156]|uniref:phosphatase PAP2 family protein n=1 Tax=Rhodococcus sp. X156 TaxID=2499145 RepID=UPI000FDB07D6|nr:phosphatase PAP2 family protein [Rhodococcus sp. X156]
MGQPTTNTDKLPDVRVPRWVPPVLVLGLLVLWVQVVWGGPIITLDEAVQRHFATRQNTPWAELAQVITHLGDPPVAIFLLLLGVAVLCGRRQYWVPMIFAGSASLLLVVAVLSLKHLVGRPGLDGESGVLWPSGHTTTATVVYGVVACLLAPRWRRSAWALAVGVPALVGVSLVVRDFHWVADVLAGWLLGPLLIIAAAALTRAWVRAVPTTGQLAAAVEPTAAEPTADVSGAPRHDDAPARR